MDLHASHDTCPFPGKDEESFFMHAVNNGVFEFISSHLFCILVAFHWAWGLRNELGFLFMEFNWAKVTGICLMVNLK